LIFAEVYVFKKREKEGETSSKEVDEV